jgi:predicted RNA-binding Zn ribbon-like protein
MKHVQPDLVQPLRGPRLAGLTAADARRFRTGRACLDFCHTGGDGPLARFELLHDTASAAYWLGVVLSIEGIQAAGSDLSPVRELRRAIWGAAHALIAGGQVSDPQRRVINAAAADLPVVPLLDAADGLAVGRPVTISQVMSTLARDAIDLFSGRLAAHIRVCSAADCGLLFVDQSRRGDRRWCSMQRCGNLAKVRRHRAAVARLVLQQRAVMLSGAPA